VWPRFTTPATIQLRRAQITLMLATLVPTVFMSALGILLLLLGTGTEAIVIGVLVLAFCSASLTGYILGSIFVSRGADVARFQTDFLSAVSHELRTPLTSILLFLETLRDERLDAAEKRQCLELLDREVRRLQGLVERLLNLSRLEAGRETLELKPVPLKDVVDEALVALAATSMHKPVTVKVDVDEQALTLGDPSALAQALSNLLINAWKYTPDGDKRIQLEVKSRERFVDIKVTDNGPGIPRDERRVIFNQFERGRFAINANVSGSGLGLAIVRAIVIAHRGKLDVKSRPGSGAEFRIRLLRYEPREKAA
jgi:two-component system phosphate regulon sensor histidine kinase PhoR